MTNERVLEFYKLFEELISSMTSDDYDEEKIIANVSRLAVFSDSAKRLQSSTALLLMRS